MTGGGSRACGAVFSQRPDDRAAVRSGRSGVAWVMEDLKHPGLALAVVVATTHPEVVARALHRIVSQVQCHSDAAVVAADCVRARVAGRQWLSRPPVDDLAGRHRGVRATKFRYYLAAPCPFGSFGAFLGSPPLFFPPARPFAQSFV